MTAKPMKVWDWRDAVRQAALEPNTKLLLYTIAVYMNGMGEGAFPSYETLAVDTGLDRRTVMRHVKKAVGAGFIAKEKAWRGDGSLTTNRYACRYPDDVSVFDNAAGGVVSPVSLGVVTGEGGVVTPVSLGSVTRVTPYNSPINSTTLLTSLPEGEAPQDFPEYPTAGGAVGKAGAASIGAVQEALRKLPSAVKAVRYGRPVVVTEAVRADARAYGEALTAFVQPAGLPALEDLVLTQRATFFVNPDLAQLREEFHEHGWKMDLSGLPLWAVAEAFRLWKDDNPQRKPRAASIGVSARNLLVPLNVAIADCEKLAVMPLTERQRSRSAEEKAAVSEMAAEICRTLRAAPGPEPPRGV